MGGDGKLGFQDTQAPDSLLSSHGQLSALSAPCLGEPSSPIHWLIPESQIPS